MTKVDPAAGKVTLDHAAIPKLDMDAMTMAYPVKDPAMLKDLKRRRQGGLRRRRDGRLLHRHEDPGNEVAPWNEALRAVVARSRREGLPDPLRWSNHATPGSCPPRWPPLLLGPVPQHAGAQPARGAPAALERARETMANRFPGHEADRRPDRTSPSSSSRATRRRCSWPRRSSTTAGTGSCARPPRRSRTSSRRRSMLLKQWQVRSREAGYRPAAEPRCALGQWTAGPDRRKRPRRKASPHRRPPPRKRRRRHRRPMPLSSPGP